MRGLSVVIPSKTASNLEVCLRALRESESLNNIVVDDGIDWTFLTYPGLHRWNYPESDGFDASGLCPGCNADFRDEQECRCDGFVVEGRNPFVFAGNVNIGIKAAGDDDVVVLNDDALLQDSGGFSLLQKTAEEHPEYGIIGATTNVTGQPLQQRKNIGLREVPHIAFVCVLIPRRTIEQIGLLDERYCLDYGVEDRDYCEAVTRAGLKVGVHDGCYVDHASLVSTFRGDPRTTKSYSRNLQLFREKWGTA